MNKQTELAQMLGRIKSRCIREKRDPSAAEIEQINSLMELIESIETRSMRPLTWPPSRGSYKSSEGPYESLGEFLRDVRNAEIPGGRVNKRLHETRAASGLSEAVPSDGGYTVQSDFATQLIEDAYKTGKLAPLCNTFELSTNSNRIEINGIDETSRATGSRWGGIRGYWLDEAAEKTKSAPKFRKIKLKLNKLIGLCYATDELLEDSSMLEGVIRRGFASEFGFLIDDSIINGTGVGQPLGIINAGCLVTQAKESGQSAATIVYENLINMWSRLLPGSEQNAVWLYNKDCLPQLATMSVDGSGNSPIFQVGTGAASAGSRGPVPATIFGRPAFPMEQCQTLGTAGDIYLADFSNYVLARKGGVQAAMSIHVRFIYDESVFRFVVRLDGQPAHSSAITPFKGSNSLSAFINLATRSS
jgi:HK97 family phage major capsid protein